MKSVMKHDFSKVPQALIPRSVFNRSHSHKTTFNAGDLIPFYVDEALPGDTFNIKATIFARLATPIYPIMDNLFCDVHYFAVPNRLVWDNFQKFMGEQENPNDSTDFLIPQISAPATTGWEVGTLSDYFGLPTGIPNIACSALWHRAYNLIWNQWYRDQNIQDSLTVDKGDSPSIPDNYKLQKRGKRHDYFTSALPFPQKGPAVELPLGDSAPIKASVASVNYLTILDSNNVARGISPDGSTNYDKIDTTSSPQSPNTPMFADLSSATSATINSLRQAFQLQKLYERDARGGTRYTEIVRSHFSVISPDARLQRPEYLGGTSARVDLTSVTQTGATGTYTPNPLGTLGAVGTITVKGAGFTKSFTEHCVIIGLLSVRSDLTYQQGMPRMFSRKSRFDFYFPALAHLGEQSVLNKEIFADGTANDDLVFGYQERWAEYRYFPSKITGQMRSSYTTPLDAWHLSQEFATLPTLSPAFIEENPPMERILAVTTGPDFIMDSFIEARTARPMPVYSVPGLIDHF